MNRTLPDGWAWTKIADVTENVPGLNPAQYGDREFGYVDISSIDNCRFMITEVKRITGKSAPSRARRPIQPGDILFSNVRTYLRNVALVPKGTDAALCSTGFTVLRPTAAILPRFLFHYVLSNDFIDRVTPKQTGTHYPATSDRLVMEERIPLPPMSEQEQIVAALDALIGKIDNCRRHLAHARTLLAQFRRSVLATACSGRLTADWREGQADDESASMPDWRPSQIGDVIDDLRYGTAQKCEYARNGTPVLRIPNIGAGVIEQHDLKFARLRQEEQRRLSLEAGDTLLIRSNGSVGLVGKAALVRKQEAGFAFAGYLIRLRPNVERILPHYLTMMLNGPMIRRQIELTVRSTSGVHNINGDEIRALSFHLPPISEQAEIVRRCEALIRHAERVEQQVDEVEAKCKTLQPALLAMAFGGGFVNGDARRDVHGLAMTSA